VIFTDFDFASAKHDIRRCFGGLEDQRRNLRRPKMTRHGHTIGNTRARKSKRGSNEVKQGVHGTATTMGCPWWGWHGRAVWHARPCISVCSRFAFFFRALSFYYAVFRFVLRICLQSMMYLAAKWTQFHSTIIPLPFVLVFRFD